mgnify:CR=1 FL=1
MAITQSEIEEQAKAPKRTMTDEGTVEERRIEDIIKADEYGKAQSVGDVPLHGLRVSQFKPAGAV